MSIERSRSRAAALVTCLLLLTVPPPAVADEVTVAAKKGHPAVFHPLSPVEIANVEVGSGSPRQIALTGTGGIPPGDATALALVVDVGAPTATSVLTIDPSGSGREQFELTAGRSAVTGVTLPIGPDGAAEASLSTGTAQVSLVATGYWASPIHGGGDVFVALDPTRVQMKRTLREDAPQTLDLARALGERDATAVALSISTSDSTAPAAISLSGSLGGMVAARTAPRSTRTSSIVFPLDGSGDAVISLDSGTARLDVIVTGYWHDANARSGALFIPLGSKRVGEASVEAGDRHTLRLGKVLPRKVTAVPLTIQLRNATSSGTAVVASRGAGQTALAHDQGASTVTAWIGVSRRPRVSITLSDGEAAVEAWIGGYTRKLGTRLTVSVLHLPPTAEGLVVVEGPNGFKRRLARTTELTDVVPGTYRVSARVIEDDDFRFFPRVADKKIELKRGQSGVATVDYLDTVPKTTHVVRAAAIEGAERSGSSTTLHLAPSAASDVQTGDVVALGVSDDLPNGALGRVTEVSAAGSQTVVTMRDVDLIEAIPRGEFAVAGPLGAEDVLSRSNLRVLTPMAMRDRVTGRTTVSAVRRPISKSVHCGDEGSIEVSGSVSIEPALDARASWGWSWTGPKLEQASLVASITETAELRASAQAGAHCVIEKTPLLAQPVRFAPIVVTIGPVPVVLSPQLQLFLEADGEIAVSMSASVTQQLVARAGIGYDDGRVYPIAGVDNTFDYQPPAHDEVRAHLGAEVAGQLSVLVYGVAGPGATLSAGLSLEVNPAAPSWWKLVGELEADVDFAVPALRVEKSIDDVIDIERVLAKAANRRLTVGDPPVPVEFAEPEDVAHFDFGGTAGAKRAFMITGLKSGITSATHIALFRPDGTEFESTDAWFVAHDEGFWGPFELDDTGTWTIVFDPPETDTTGGTVQLLEVPDDFEGRMEVDKDAVEVDFVGPGQRARIEFGGSKGARRGFLMTGFRDGISSATQIEVRRPDGTLFESTDAWFVQDDQGFWGPFELDATGTWTLVIDPPRADVTDGSVQLISIPDDIEGRLTADDAPIAVDFTGPGQAARFEFGGSEGAAKWFAMSGFNGSINGNFATHFTVRRPDGTEFASTDMWFVNHEDGTWGPLELDATGTWTIIVNPSKRDMTDGTIQLRSSA